MLWFLDLARQAGFVAKAYTDAVTGTMTKDADGEFWVSKVDLYPVTVWDGSVPSDQELAELHHAAHAKCFIANSVKTVVTTHPAPV